MISKFDKERLVRYLGSHYSHKVSQRLQHIGIVGRNGKPYSSTAVRTIINTRNHQDIEQAVVALISETETQKKLQQLQH